jgi:hypothetical protein
MLLSDMLSHGLHPTAHTRSTYLSSSCLFSSRPATPTMGAGAGVPTAARAATLLRWWRGGLGRQRVGSGPSSLRRGCIPRRSCPRGPACPHPVGGHACVRWPSTGAAASVECEIWRREVVPENLAEGRVSWEFRGWFTCYYCGGFFIQNYYIYQWSFTGFLPAFVAVSLTRLRQPISHAYDSVFILLPTKRDVFPCAYYHL